MCKTNSNNFRNIKLLHVLMNFKKVRLQILSRRIQPWHVIIIISIVNNNKDNTLQLVQ